MSNPVGDAPTSHFLVTSAGPLYLPRFPSQSKRERVQVDRVFMTRLPIDVGPSRKVAIRISVLVDGVHDCVQLRDRDATVLRRCKGRRDLLRDSKRMEKCYTLGILRCKDRMLTSKSS